jgi:hypothetical protein
MKTPAPRHVRPGPAPQDPIVAIAKNLMVAAVGLILFVTTCLILGSALAAALNTLP